MTSVRLGFALCGSFCTIPKVLPVFETLIGRGYDITPIMSETVYSTDTRFGAANEINSKINEITGKEIIHTIKQSEPIGPKSLLDILLIAPCTGNTLAKLAGGITDSAVTMAAKAHARNGRPIVIAPSTNDGLSGSAKNIGFLLNTRGVYFVPFGQDDPVKKPRSLAADFSLIPDTLEAALSGEQLQPMLLHG